MEFGTVLILICVVGALVAVLSFWGTGEIYKGLGRTGGLSMDEPNLRPQPKPGSALSKPAATPRDDALREEVRQLVLARNERRARQGKPPLDVEAEIERQLSEFGA